jgi:hypothetical protein
VEALKPGRVTCHSLESEAVTRMGGKRLSVAEMERVTVEPGVAVPQRVARRGRRGRTM